MKAIVVAIALLISMVSAQALAAGGAKKSLPCMNIKDPVARDRCINDKADLGSRQGARMRRFLAELQTNDGAQDQKIQEVKEGVDGANGRLDDVEIDVETLKTATSTQGQAIEVLQKSTLTTFIKDNLFMAGTVGLLFNEKAGTYGTISISPGFFALDKRLVGQLTLTLGRSGDPVPWGWSLKGGVGYRLVGGEEAGIMLFAFADVGYTAFMRRLNVNNTDRDGWGGDLGLRLFVPPFTKHIYIQASGHTIRCFSPPQGQGEVPTDEGFCWGGSFDLGVTTF